MDTVEEAEVDMAEVEVEAMMMDTAVDAEAEAEVDMTGTRYYSLLFFLSFPPACCLMRNLEVAVVNCHDLQAKTIIFWLGGSKQ